MADETERKFKQIMDKLYHSASQKSPPPSCGKGMITPAKRRRWELGFEAEAERSVRRAASEEGPSPCRPWDRGDLMRRLATFKAMTWFGKPKAIDPVNCARRGWKNIEMDTIACESCGSRILFSNPSSWNLQQVENAAAVFSLKLESGHKLLCPWIDNICDETLAYFPPTANPVLVEGFQERSSALLRLSALPIISPTAVEFMKSPQLEILLTKRSNFCHGFDGGMKLMDSSESLVFDGVSEADMSRFYHEAHLILSLCGWEPRPVPYVVESVTNSSGKIIRDHNRVSVVSILADSRERDESRDHPSSGQRYDPGSVVLECKLCGACIGLWAFKTVSRPLEVFNLIESPYDRLDESTHHQRSSSQSLTLTIAGGPPPTRQSFRPRISLPIVTRHLRSVYETNDAEVRSHNQSQTQTLALDQEGQDNILKDKGDENEKILSEDPQLNENATAPDMAVNNADISDRGQSQALSLDQVGQDNVLKDMGDENAKKLLDFPQLNKDSTVPDTSVKNVNIDGQVQSQISTLDQEDFDDILKDEGDENKIFLSEHSQLEEDATAPDMVVNDTDSRGHGQSLTLTTDHDGRANGLNNKVDKTEKNLLMDPQLNGNATAPDMAVNEEGCQTSEGLVEAAENRISSNQFIPGSIPNLVSRKADDADKFDPIHQHRPFCPWVDFRENKNLPGWQLTLQALVNDKSSPRASPLPPSEEVNDPILSIRRLFSSPPQKRSKGSD